MEEEKKKKKNKKKKNKQNTLKINNDTSSADVDVDVLVGDSTSPAGTGTGTGSGSGMNQTSATTQACPMDVSHLPELDTQALTLQENIQKLPLEKDLSLQKEAGLLEKIEELQNDKAEHTKQEASLQGQILQLEKEKDAYMEKEAGLEKMIAELQLQKEFHTQKESSLEEKIGQLLSDKESWYHKEALFEEKINHLMDEAATLSLKEVSLEEKVIQMEKERDSLVLQENTTKEVIASLNGDKSRLKSQVVELEELRNSLLQENHLLKETISDLQLQILKLEREVFSESSSENKMHGTENGDAGAQTEAGHALVEKLTSENAEPVEKANELYGELRNKSLQNETSSTVSFSGVEGSFHGADSSAGLQPKVGATETHKTAPAFDLIDEVGEKMIRSDVIVQAPKNYANNNERSDEYLHANNTVLFPDSSNVIESSEIVQIPLDENEREQTDMEAANDVEMAEVSLTDSPLIGAPFRLIAYVARYVSGADLVEKNSVNSGT